MEEIITRGDLYFADLENQVIGSEQARTRPASMVQVLWSWSSRPSAWVWIYALGWNIHLSGTWLAYPQMGFIIIPTSYKVAM